MGRKLNTSEFIERSLNIHGNKYDYSKVEYVNTDSHVIIICPEHGDFEQTPYHHTKRQQGCPECGKIKCSQNLVANKILSREVKNQPEDYKLIQLTQKRFAKVDNEDFERLKSINWSVSHGYAFNYYKGRMHRYIMNCPEGLVVDHINHDKLDNRKSNLRICTQDENMLNSKPKIGTSIYKGVYFSNKSQKWVSDIVRNGKKKRIGTFDTEEEAGMAYDRKALELHGEFAYLNFPELKQEYLKEIKNGGNI